MRSQWGVFIVLYLPTTTPIWRCGLKTPTMSKSITTGTQAHLKICQLVKELVWVGCNYLYWNRYSSYSQGTWTVCVCVDGGRLISCSSQSGLCLLRVKQRLGQTDPVLITLSSTNRTFIPNYLALKIQSKLQSIFRKYKTHSKDVAFIMINIS